MRTYEYVIKITTGTKKSCDYGLKLYTGWSKAGAWQSHFGSLHFLSSHDTAFLFVYSLFFEEIIEN